MSTSVHLLRVNPAQMRTRVDLLELAQLAVQVRGGLDPNLGLLLRPDEKGAFIVISGHRRWLALMIAHIAYTAPTSSPMSAEQDLELMQSHIEDVCTVEEGFVILDEGLYEFLITLVPETLTVPYSLWHGPPEDEILLLIKANVGAEEPDLLGQAHAYKAAIERGVSWDTLSQTVGQAAGRLQALVTLLDLPEIFGALIQDDLLNLSVVLDLPALKTKAVKALGQALAAKYKADKKQADKEGVSLSDYKGYTSRVQMAIVQLGTAPEVPDSKSVEPSAYNLAVATGALWQRGIESAPAQLYKEIAARALEGHRLIGHKDMIEIMAEMPKLKRYFKTRADQYGRVEIAIHAEAIQEILPDLVCSSCVFIGLPANRIRHELPFPCRQKSTGCASGPCLSWTPKGQKFAMRTPWYWNKGGEAVTTFKKLRAAWQAQWNREQHGEGQASEQPAESIVEQRRDIRYYMETHTEPPFVQHHLWATSCAGCEHRLDKSPVKSAPDAPHCTWAKGRRRLRFEAYVPEAVTDAALVAFEPSRGTIPCCAQFKPTAAWSELVPEADTPPPFARELLVSMILEVGGSVNRNCYGTDSRGAVQFLTGRPLLASANHRRTFKGRFMKEKEALSDGQLWTLLQWLFLEWLRIQSHTRRQVVPWSGGETLETRIINFRTAVHWEDKDE